MRSPWNMVVNGFTAVGLVLLGVVGAVLGCTVSGSTGSRPVVPCESDSLAGTYQTDVLGKNDSPIALFGENGVSQATFNVGDLDIVSTVTLSGTGATFNERWREVGTGDELDLQATGTLVLICGGNELRAYDIDWGPTAITRSTFDTSGVLAPLAVGTVAVSASTDSAVILRDGDISGGRVVRLTVAGPGPMADGTDFSLQ